MADILRFKLYGMSMNMLGMDRLRGGGFLFFFSLKVTTNWVHGGALIEIDEVHCF